MWLHAPKRTVDRRAIVARGRGVVFRVTRGLLIDGSPRFVTVDFVTLVSRCLAVAGTGAEKLQDEKESGHGSVCRVAVAQVGWRLYLRATCRHHRLPRPQPGSVRFFFVLQGEIAMGKRLKCSDVGMDCDFAAWGETEEELLELVVLHARESHGIEELTPELMEQVRASIRDV